MTSKTSGPTPPDKAELRQGRGSGVLSTPRQVRHLSRQLSQFPQSVIEQRSAAAVGKH